MQDTWVPVPRPAELVESRLIEAILCGQFAIDEFLPAERELATQLGVTRPTLREALQRLARDGWVEIRHGRPTRVRNFWQEGSLGVLEGLTRHPEYAPADFVPNLMQLRILIAPTYTRLAVENAAAALARILQSYETLPDTAKAFAEADWRLHHRLTIMSGNPIFTLLLNSFGDLYLKVAVAYFGAAIARQWSLIFYGQLREAALAGDGAAAGKTMLDVTQRSLVLWQEMTGE